MLQTSVSPMAGRALIKFEKTKGQQMGFMLLGGNGDGTITEFCQCVELKAITIKVDRPE